MICLDANVLIELILVRKNVKACREYIDAVKDDLATTMLSLDLVMYYADSNKLELPKIKQFLRLFVWLPLVDSDAEWAFEHFANKDFEGALQIACAGREGCTKFVTQDKSLAKKYSRFIPVDLL